MTSKKSGLSRALAFATAFALFLTLTILIPPGSLKATAEYENAVPVEQAGMTINAFSVKVNGNELKKGDTVRNGDQLDLTFQWELPNDHEYTDSVFVCDLTDKLNGINLPSQTIPVGNIAIYKVSGSKLYIQLLEGSIGRSGSCELSGTISVDENDVDQDGKFTLKFFDKSIEVIAPEFTTPGLYITKEASGKVTYRNGKYYQTFVIYVGSNGKTTADVNIKDFGTGLYNFSGLSQSNVTVYKGSQDITSTVIGTLTPSQKGFSLDLGTVEEGWDNRVKIEYTVEVASDIINPSLSWDDRKNTAQVYVGDKLQQTNYGYAQYTPPTVSKSGVLSDDKSYITWTITVNLNDYEDQFMSDDDKKITLKDILDSRLGTEGLVEKLGESATKELVKTDFSNGVYTITYDSSVSDDLINSASSNSVSNKAQITYEDTYSQESTASVNIPGTVGDFVDKSCSANGDNIQWTVKINIPDVEINSIDISDYMDVDSEFISSGTVFTVSDEEGNSITPQINWSNNRQFTLSIDNKTFINNNRNKTLTLTYSTPSNNVSRVTNTATVTLKFSDNTSAEDRDPAVFTIPGTKEGFPLDKIYYDNMSSLKGAMAWHIAVTKGEDYMADDEIVVTDTLPAGLEYVENSFAVNIDNKYYFNNSNNGNISYANADYENGTIKFTIKLNEANATALNNSYSKAIDIAYITKMTDSEYISWITGNVPKNYSNNASISFDSGTSYTGITAVQVMTPDGKDVVNKFISGTIAPGENNTDLNYYAEYTVEINKEKLNLIDDAYSNQTFSATDCLGSNLEYVENSIHIVSDPAMIDSEMPDAVHNDGIISITGFKDETTYTITYKVKVKQIYRNDSYTNDQLDNMFGNTISVSLGGQNSIDSSTRLDESTFRSKGDYTFNQGDKTLTIKGKKLWKSDNNSIRPSSIKIKLEVVKYVTPNTAGNAEEIRSDSTSKEYTFSVDSQSYEWAYTINDLPLYIDSSDGKVRYEYSISEVSTDGYKVEYSVDNNNNINVKSDSNTSKITINDKDNSANSVYSLNITNTFNADQVEVGTVKVTKNWLNETGIITSRPQVSFTLTDSTGNISITKTLDNSLISSTGEAQFTNLPLYTYSKATDTSGNEILVRTPRRYTITETSTDESFNNYTPSYSEQTFTITNDTSYRKDMTMPVKTVTVNNRYSAPTISTPQNITLIKTYEDTELAGMFADDRNDILNSTQFTLYSDAATTTTVAGPRSPAWDAENNRAVVTFTATDGLACGTTYYLKETASHNDYITSANVYKCVIAADGTVSYSIEAGTSNGTTLDGFPICENTKTGSVANRFNVTISKKSVNGTDELPGARLTVYRYDNNQLGTIVDSWTSGDTARTIQLAAGSYLLVETTAPNGYLTAESIAFAVNADGSVSLIGNNGELNGNTITMRDELSPATNNFTVQISKKAVNGTDELPGARLTVYSYDNNQLGTIVDSWTSEDTARTIQLAAGSYLLVETTAPNGYLTAESIAFAVNADGSVSLIGNNGELNGNTITMRDELSPATNNFTVQISKKAVNGTDELPGARLTVYSYDNNQLGTIVDSWTSEDTARTIQLAAGSYLLVETTAPNGYLTAESIAFTVNADGSVSLIGNNGELNGNTITMRDEQSSADGPIIPDNPNPEYPDYPIYPNEPVYPPYYPIQEVPPFLLYPETPDESEDVSSGAGISESADETSSGIGVIAAAVFISSLIATAAAGIFGKKKHNR